MFIKTLTSAAVLASVCGLHAQTVSSAGWTLTGDIVPGNCSLNLGNSGTADFGILSTAYVKTWAVAQTPERYNGDLTPQVPLSVTCSQATRFALAFEDNNAASLDGPADGVRWGVGMYTPAGGPAQKIGAYTVYYTSVRIRALADGPDLVPVKLITDGIATEASVWSLATLPFNQNLAPNKSLGFALLTGATSPEAITTVLGDLGFRLEPRKDVVDNATSDIQLDGAATITLIRL